MDAQDERDGMSWMMATSPSAAHQSNLVHPVNPCKLLLAGKGVSIIVNLASALIIAVTTGASLLYVLKRPHLGGRQKLIVLALAMLAGVPVGSVIFGLLSMVGIMLFWDTGIGSDVVFLYISAPMAVLLNLMLVLIASMVNAGAAPKTETVMPDTSVTARQGTPAAMEQETTAAGTPQTAGPVVPDTGRLLLTGTIAVAEFFLLIVVGIVGGFFWWDIDLRTLLAMSVALFVLLMVMVVATIVHRYR